MDELEELKISLGEDNYRQLVNKTACRTFRQSQKRNSGKEYNNPPEKIAAIKEKYKNGVNLSQILEMIS